MILPVAPSIVAPLKSYSVSKVKLEVAETSAEPPFVVTFAPFNVILFTAVALSEDELVDAILIFCGTSIRVEIGLLSFTTCACKVNSCLEVVCELIDIIATFVSVTAFSVLGSTFATASATLPLNDHLTVSPVCKS